MARNKYPEETVKRILNVSLRLFLQKGYEHTTIQDILDGLGNLSKGAIYHHFKSKDEIFEAVLNRMFMHRDTELLDLVHNPNLTGMQKLRTIVLSSLRDPAQLQLFSIAPDMRANARFLGVQLCLVEEVARDYIKPVMLQGIQDGSICTEHPAALAELFLLIVNFWINPLIFPASEAQMEEKCMLFRSWLKEFHLEELINDEAIQHMKQYSKLVEDRRSVDEKAGK